MYAIGQTSAHGLTCGSATGFAESFMPAVLHIEKGFTATATVWDVVIGAADGLTVPFALAAGLSAAVTSTGIIVTAGLAAVAAGAIAMGLAGYLAARTDADHYAAEEARESLEMEHLRGREVEEVEAIFKEYRFQGEALNAVVTALMSDRKRWVDFLMRFELGLGRPDPKRAPISAATIRTSYLVGRLILLVPSATGVALVYFGPVKGHFTDVSMLKAASQTFLVGGFAASAAYWLVHVFG